MRHRLFHETEEDRGPAADQVSSGFSREEVKGLFEAASRDPFISAHKAAKREYFGDAGVARNYRVAEPLDLYPSSDDDEPFSSMAMS